MLGSARVRALASWVVGCLFVALSATAAAQAEAPPERAWLRYRYEQRMQDQGGAYVGYQETTLAHARYDVGDVDDATATITGRYAWTYSSSDALRTGREHRTVSFWLANRRYVDQRTDSSDYDDQDGRTLGTWIWIPPSVPEGATVEILERDFVVQSRQATVAVAGEPARPAIHLRSAGEVARSDDYGRMTVSLVDEYWFDATTGMFLREHLVERANGTLDGEPARFTLDTVVEAVAASYAPNPAAPPEPDYASPPIAPRFRPEAPARARERGGSDLARALCGLVPGVGVGGLVLLLIAFSRRSRARNRTASGEEFTVVELATPPVPGLGRVPISGVYDPFLPHMIAVARNAGERVVYAKNGADLVLGVGIDDAPAQIATIFAADTAVCEALRAKLGRAELFSDVRHPPIPGLGGSPPHAYNVYETYEILERTGDAEDLGYDPELVDPMRPTDLPEVAALFTAVYRLDCQRWLQASLAAGDVGWVARVDGRVVGAALATIVGERARLHGLTVHPDQRGRGIGTALYRARLRGLLALGAGRVLTECATWNLGALDLARAHGFSKLGLMYVESARPARVERRFHRR